MNDNLCVLLELVAAKEEDIWLEEVARYPSYGENYRVWSTWTSCVNEDILYFAPEDFAEWLVS